MKDSMAKLYINNGPMEGHSFALKSGATLIGRASDNDIQIKDISISRKHIKIFKEGNKFFVEDLKSQNGTMINGSSIKPGDKCEVEKGQPIAIGNIIISLGKVYLEDGMITQYSINLSGLKNNKREKLLYKDRRITSRKKLEMIHEVSTILMQSLDVNEICEKIMDSLFSNFKRIDSGSILLIDNKTGELRETITRSRNYKKNIKPNYSRTIVNRAIREGKAVMMSDTSREDQNNLSGSIEMMRIKSIMCVPLISESKIKGVVYVHSVNVPHGFRKDDLLLLTALTSPAAVAIDNALLYSRRKLAEEALQKARDELEVRVEERTAELSKANALLKQEIIDRKRAEKELNETNKFLRSILDGSSSISIISTDLDQNVLFWNKGATNIFGYKSEETVGRQKVNILYPDDETKKTINEIKSSILKNKEEISCEIREVTKDGRKLWFNLNLTPRFDEEGHVVGILGIGEDITERKHLEEELRQSQKMEAIGTLAGGIAHDFNNILMGIQGNASLMLLDIDSAHSHYGRLKNIEQYVQGGAELTRQLLGFASKGKYEVKSTDLNELIKKQNRMFGRTKKEITVRDKYDEKLWTVEVDQGQIGQVLLNLYINAWQSMPGGGDLYIQAENVTLDDSHVRPTKMEAGRYVKISIADTGTGMDEATRKRIFEPFFTTKEMGRGTGLGLASVYGIIKNHRGFINVQSEKGKGTTFNIFLPASGKEAIEEKELAEHLLKGTGTILLVDDEDMIINVGEDMLETIGYEVILAKNGKEAVEVYRKNMQRIDMVILDMIMPDMGGGETYDRMKEINPNIKVLLSSGYSIDGEATEILERGCNNFIQKPFDIKELSKKIREVLDKK